MALGSARAALAVGDTDYSNRAKLSKQAADSIEFRKLRKVGVGLSAAGSLGVFGAHFDLVFSQDSSLMGGFGLGDSYQSFSFQYKYSLPGYSIVPYLGFGYAKWFTVGDRNGSVTESVPNFLAKKFLNSEEQSTGVFSEDLIYPLAGFQYYQVRGAWAGMTVYLHALTLLDVDDAVSATTGELGFLFYF